MFLCRLEKKKYKSRFKKQMFLKYVMLWVKTVHRFSKNRESKTSVTRFVPNAFIAWLLNVHHERSPRSRLIMSTIFLPYVSLKALYLSCMSLATDDVTPSSGWCSVAFIIKKKLAERIHCCFLDSTQSCFLDSSGLANHKNLPGKVSLTFIETVFEKSLLYICTKVLDHLEMEG